jgi:RNA polymerase sigma-70 factor (ECF subfamily)
MVAVDVDDLACISDPEEDVEQTVERMDGDERVYLVCMRLKEPYRSVALSYYVQDETLTEISERTGENRKTVATRLRRAKGLIKMMIKEDGCDAGFE